MQQSRIDTYLRANEDRVTLFVTDSVMVYGSDAGVVCSAYEQGAHINGGVRFPIGDKHRIVTVLKDSGFPVTVVEDMD